MTMVGDNLRRLRKERGLKQDELAKAARSSQQTISEIENGHRGARTGTLEKLAGALGVPVGAFFADGGKPPVPPRPRTPLTDEPHAAFDERFAATDAASADALRKRVDVEFGALQEYIRRLKAAGIGGDDLRLKQAQRRLGEAKRRLHAVTSRATDLALNAEFGRAREVHDTVAAYVGAAQEVAEMLAAENTKARAGVI
jgi:transcriptional regulator with XRE-family HTH domain